MRKKGLSDIVTTLIIILLVLVAIGIVWVVMKNIVNKSQNYPNPETQMKELCNDYNMIYYEEIHPWSETSYYCLDVTDKKVINEYQIIKVNEDYLLKPVK